MEKEGGSSRESYIQDLKADKLELYESLEVLLYDREVRKLLCSLENGIFRDALVAALQRLLRPITKNDVIDIISNLIQLGVFDVELKTLPPRALPKQLFVKRRKTKGKRKSEEGFVEVLEPPKGFEVVGVYGDVVLLRTQKLFLKPTKELRAVCSVLKESRR
jgi:hypothetical protein